MFSDSIDPSDLIWAMCDFIGDMVGEDPDVVHARFAHLRREHWDLTGEEFDEKIDQCANKLIGPLDQLITCLPDAQNYIEGVLRDAWLGHDGKSLMDALLFFGALLKSGFLHLYVEVEDSDENCPEDKKRLH
jgi:hypothetical protein